MLHACAVRFDVMENLENFWELNKASHSPAHLSQHPHCHRSQTSAPPSLPLPPNVPSSPRAARRPHLPAPPPSAPCRPLLCWCCSTSALPRVPPTPPLDEAYPYRLGDCGILPCRTLSITSCCKCPPTY